MNSKEKKLLKEAGVQDKLHRERAAQRKEQAAKHTPGPWSYNGDKLKSTSDRIVVHQGGEFGTEQVAYAVDFNAYARDAEADANANLIAAAPELLEAANIAVKRCGCMKGVLSNQYCIGCTALRRAIAKAEGK